MALDFDVQGALAAGYTLPQIADYLGQRSQFDVAAARKSGYSDVDIVGSLAGSEAVEGLQGGTGAAARGWKTGMGETMPLAKAAIGLIGKTAESTFGEGGIWTGVKKWGMREYQKGMEETQPLRRDNDELTAAWEKASKDGNFGALMEWATRSAAYGAAQLAQAAVMSAVGGVAGAAMAPEAAPVAGAAGAVAGAAFKGEAMAAVKSLMEKAVVKEANRLMAESGGKIAAEAATQQATKTVAASIGKSAVLLGHETGLELGSIYADADERARKDGVQLTGADLAKVWGTGILAGGVGAIGDKIGLDAVTGKLSSALPGGRLARTAGGAMAAGTSNAAEEGIQTMLERAGASKEVFSQEGINDIINSMGAGFMGSAPAGAFGGIISRQRQDLAVEKGKTTLDQDLSVGGAQKAIDAAAAELRGATDAYLGVPPAAQPVTPGTPPAPLGEGGLLPKQLQAMQAAGLDTGGLKERQKAELPVVTGVPRPAERLKPTDPKFGTDDALALREMATARREEADAIDAHPHSTPADRARAVELRNTADQLDQWSDKIDSQSELVRRRNRVDLDESLTKKANEAGFQFDRDQALEQRNAMYAKPAAPGGVKYVELQPMDSRAAMNRVSVLRDMTANEGGNALGLTIVPHPTVQGKYAIAERALPSLKLEPLAAPKMSEAEASGKIEAAAAAAPAPKTPEAVRAERAVSVIKARVDERGGVASPTEASLLAELGAGKPYDRIDPTLDRLPSEDQKLTEKTGILVGSEAGLGYGAPESKLPRQEAKASNVKVNQRERALPSDEATVAQARLEHAAAQGRLAAAQTNDLQQALARPAGENPVEALRNVKGNATTPADVQRLIDAANERRDAAETAEIERMLAEDASADETAQGQAKDRAAAARRELVDRLLDRFAWPNDYSAKVVIPLIDRQLASLGQEPMSKYERARVENLLGRTRAFLQLDAPANPIVVADRGVDNSSMERHIPERGAKGQAGTPKPKVPRPSKVGGVPTEQLTDEQLSATAGNDQLPAITRRGATVELQAREEERQAPAAEDNAPAAEQQVTNADLAKRALDPKLPAEERRAALVELQSRKTAAAPAEKQQPAAAETEKPGRQLTELQQRAAFAKAIGAVSEAGGHFLHGRSNRKLGAAVEKGDWIGFAQALADSKNPVVARIGALALKLKGYSVGIDADAQETRRVAAAGLNREGTYLRAAFLELLDKMRAVAPQIEQGKESEVSRTLSGFRNEAFERYAALYQDDVPADKSFQQSIDALIPNIPFGIITSKAQFREALTGLEKHAEEIGEARMRADASQAGSGTRIAGAVLGAYDAKAKRVTAVYERAAKDEGVMAHEAAHAVLSDIIDNPTPEQAPLVARLRELHEHVQGVMQAETDKKNEALGQDRRISYDIPYGATSLQEFVAEGIGNPDFQYRLSRIAYQGKTAWGKFTEFVANLLGLKNDNAFTEFLAIKEQLTGDTAEKQAPATDVYATKAEAKEAQRQQPEMRVVKTDEGFYALAPKTEAQIAAQAAAARRLAGNVGANGGPLNINQFIAFRGGLADSEKSDLGVEGNVRVGSMWLFRKTGMTMDGAVEILREAGYLKNDDHNEARDLIHRTMRGDPQYTPDGWDRIAEAEAQSRYEDHLEAQREEAAKATDEWTPEAIMAEDVQAVPELGRASDTLKAEVAALLDLAAAHEIDTEASLEAAAIATAEGTENDYYQRAKENLQAAIAQSDRSRSDAADGSGAQGRPRQEAERGSREAGDEDPGRPGYALEQPTSEEVVARQDQDVDTLDDLAQIRRESEAGAGLFDLKMQDGRQDTTGSLFSTQRAGDSGEVRQDGETHRYTVTQGLTGQAGLTKVLREVARAFGKQVVFFQSDTLKADGFVRPGNNQVVHINADSKMSPVAVLGHEMMHLFKMDNPVAYRAIATVLARQVDAGGRALFRADYGLGANMEELSADLLGNAFQDPGFLSSVFAEIGATAPEGQARSIVQRLVSALSNAIAAALKVIQGMGVQPGFKADMLVKDLEAVRSALRLAMVEYGKGQREQAQGAAQTESGEMRASRQRGQDQTETPAFKRWFNDSKVVDENGKPLVVYHGSRFGGFSVFMRSAGGFIYTTPNAEYASSFSGGSEGSAVYPVYVSVQNPLDLRDLGERTVTAAQLRDFLADKGVNLDAVEQWEGGPVEQVKLYGEGPAWRLLREDGVSLALEKAGYDGAILREGDGQDAYLAFRPEQIKSAIGNNGEFDPANRDITMSRQRGQDQTETPAFKRWFKDSKVVDADGKPLVVYHASLEDFNEFKPQSWGTAGDHQYFYFAVAKQWSKRFAKEEMATDKPVLRSFYLSLQNPLDMRGLPDKTGKQWLQYFADLGITPKQNLQGKLEAAPPRMAIPEWQLLRFDTPELGGIREQLLEKGYDGLILSDVVRGKSDNTTYIAFDPAQIKSATGNQGTFDPANPDITMSRQRIFGDNDRQRTPEQLAMFQRIGRAVEEPTITERIAELRKDLGKKLVQGIVDQFAPLKEISTKAYQLARLAKGASGAMEAMLHHGKLSIRDGVYDADMSGGVLERLGVPLHGEFDDFLNWVAGHRAERLMAEGRENLFSQADIDASKTLADGTTNFDYTLQHGPNAGQVTRDRTLIYQDALKTFNEFNKNALDIAEQSGLIDPEARKVWESEFYVPFYRVSEEGFMGDTLKNGLVRQQVIATLKGGTDKLNDLMSNTLLNWAHLIDAAAKNRAALASLDSARQMGLAIEASEDVARQMAKAMGIKSQVVWAMDGGKRRFFVVEDKAMLQAITSLQYAGLKGPLMDAMGAFKHALTIGVTASPAFKIRNLARDSIQAIASAPLSYNLFKNLAEGYQASDPKSQTYVSALASGGLIRFGTMIEGNEAARTRRLVKMGVKDSTILNSKSKIDALWTKIEKGFMAYQELGNRGEEINRAALYKQLIDQGVPHGEAALQARDLMDFSLQGTFTTVRFLSQVVPFLNARLQGLYKLGRAGKEDPRRFAAVLGSVALASVALMMAYKDDDDWKKREDWDRNNYWWFKFGGEAFRIPKPFEIGAMATLAERGLDYFINPEMTGRRLYENVRDILMDQLSMNPIPQVVKPILDIYSNKDSFSGRPIEPMGMDRLRPDYRYTINSSMLARGISTAGQAVASQVNGQFLSPVQIDHLLHGYFSWLGTFVVGATDMALRPLTGQPERPAADFWKVATQGIVQDANSPQSRYVSQMYQQAKEVEQAYSTWNMLRKQGRLEEADQFLTDNADTIQRYKQVEKVKERETKINERIRMIERSAMSADDKKAQISELQAMRDQTARLLAQ